MRRKENPMKVLVRKTQATLVKAHAANKVRILRDDMDEAGLFIITCNGEVLGEGRATTVVPLFQQAVTRYNNEASGWDADGNFYVVREVKPLKDTQRIKVSSVGLKVVDAHAIAQLYQFMGLESAAYLAMSTQLESGAHYAVVRNNDQRNVAFVGQRDDVMAFLDSHVAYWDSELSGSTFGEIHLSLRRVFPA